MLSRSDLARLASALGGLPILGCLEASPAAQAGLRYGDVLLALDGAPTPDWDAFITARGRCKDSMRVRIFREGIELEVHVPLRPNQAHPIEMLGELVARDIVTTASESSEN